MFRELLALPEAAGYFPDLTLKNGKVHRIDGSRLVSLETVTNVQRPNGNFEDQLVGFMSYLNPDTLNAGDSEARNAARLMHWHLNHPGAVRASVKVAFSIMHRKIKARATTYRLAGRDPRLAIWVSDISHQGRGSKAEIKAALAKSRLADQLKALAAIPAGNSTHDTRRKTVRERIAELHAEKVFDGVLLGDAKLPL